MVHLRHLDPASAAVWEALFDLADLQPDGWTLVGAQMVNLHGIENDRVLGRATVDAGLLVDVRRVRGGTARLSQLLIEQGFELDGIDGFGVGHQFSRGPARFDVLAPDGLPKRGAHLTTTIPPAHTVSVPGGTQALQRSRLVEVRIGARQGRIPCPDLLGAVLIKARAADVDDVPNAQLSDLAFLLTLVEDPRVLATELRGQERQWLKRRSELLERSHPAWRLLSERDADDGFIALRILAGA